MSEKEKIYRLVNNKWSKDNVLLKNSIYFDYKDNEIYPKWGCKACSKKLNEITKSYVKSDILDHCNSTSHLYQLKSHEISKDNYYEKTIKVLKQKKIDNLAKENKNMV